MTSNQKGEQTTRRVHMGWDEHNEFPNMYRTWAECADEITTIIIALPDDVDTIGFMAPDEQAMVDSPYYQSLLMEHLNRCGACRDWSADSTNLHAQVASS